MSVRPSFPTALPGQNNGKTCAITGAGGAKFPAVNRFNMTQPTPARTNSPSSAAEYRRSTFSESESSDMESGNEHKDHSDNIENVNSPSMRHVQPFPARIPRSGGGPRFYRALSVPPASQLGFLKHPYRSYPWGTVERCSFSSSNSSPRMEELAVELADSVQMMIQTMLQVSPPQLLDASKEQLSACSFSVPTSSMSSMYTSMKNLNYISANMPRWCSGSSLPRGVNDSESEHHSPNSQVDFDIGEMLQSVGDSLSGMAAQAGVDLVLYHGEDIFMRHVLVRGDENGTAYALCHVLRRVLETTRPSDSIEIGLLLGVANSKTGAPVQENGPSETEAPLFCTIRVSHKFGSEFKFSISGNKTPSQDRSQPAFSSAFLRCLLDPLGATLDFHPATSTHHQDSRTFDFVLPVRRGLTPLSNTPLVGQSGDRELLSAEPSVEQLSVFTDRLKGKKVFLYARDKGSFPRYLSRHLTAMGMDVTQVSPDTRVNGLTEASTMALSESNPSGVGSPKGNGISGPLDSSQSPSLQPSFILIDDDIEILKERLQVLREKLMLRKRPSLASNHRPRSIPQTKGPTMPTTSSSTVIVHFVSLINYKAIKDLVQSVVSSHSSPIMPLPEVMIILKPAAPRRYLTALYSAVMKPVVDPLFSPIATSPSSPTKHKEGPFPHSYNNTDNSSSHSNRPSPKTPRPPPSRHSSDRSTKSAAKDITELCKQPTPTSSPLTMSESIEYFPDTAVQLGTTASSGLVIQSPDGQPAGIFFHPRRGSKTPALPGTEKDKGQLQVPPMTLGDQAGWRPSSRLAVTVTEGNGGGPCSPGTPLSYLRGMASSPGSSPSRTAMRKSPRPPFSSAPSSVGIGAEGSGSPGSFFDLRHRSSSDALTPGKKVGENDEKQQGTATPGKRAPSRRTTVDGAVPVATAMATASKKAKAAGDGNIVPPISVLIVDDNPINQTILSAFMRKKGIQYEVASNGQEAVQKWKTGGFHLILMDIQMPVMDGIQATKEIRQLERAHAAAGYLPATPSFDERPPPLRTPSDSSSSDTRPLGSPYRSSVIIVALTASSLQADRVAALGAGCNDFLTKPVSLVWLNSKIIEWGSIKALQMWADPRPDMSLSSAQAAQARTVAERLHVPNGKQPRARTPSPGDITGGTAKTSTVATNGNRRDVPSPPPSPKTLNELAKGLAQGGRRVSVTVSTVASGFESERASFGEGDPKP